MDSQIVDENEVKTWLKVALSDKNFADYDIKIVGNTEKGEGFVGDIIFVELSSNQTKYHLVLKCSKSNETFFNKMRGIYLQESLIYDKIFPAFRKFEESKKIKNVFDSVPKCYGVYNTETRSVIVLENLLESGYGLWNKRMPLTRHHINLVLQEHAHFHALSIAMKEQQPEKYNEMLKTFKKEVFNEVALENEFPKVFQDAVDEIHELLQNDLDSKSLKKWITFKEKILNFFHKDYVDDGDLKTLVHGDCWTNNFMYKHENGDLTKPKVKILDWQTLGYSTPIIDVSYFIFACISPEDLTNVTDILKYYYNSLSNHLNELGSSFMKNYPLEKFLKEWQKYGSFGVMMCIVPIKLSFTEKEDVPDMVESIETNDDMTESFKVKLRNPTEFKKRIIPIIQYVVDNDLL